MGVIADVLQIAGAALIVAAALIMFGLAAGLLVAGVACIVFGLVVEL